jgi:hypothetical protein
MGFALMAERDDAAGQSPGVMSARLVVGLAQGIALYLLYAASDDKTWPATDGYVFAPLVFVSLYVPLIVLVGLGNLRAVTLAVWTLLAAAIVAGLGWYGIWRWPLELSGEPHIAPEFDLFLFTTVGLFIAHSLIAGGDQDRRFIARYTTHFDVAWKFGLQAALSVVFVAIFWAVLELGAALFNLISIDVFSKLIEHRWFAIPATTLALAAAIHLTDVRAGLVRGTRTLVLVLLSWLLPLMTIIAAGFLASLPFTGLAPLWKTGFAAGYLLTAAGVLVFLINAARQDGESEHVPQAILRVAGSVAAFLLVPLVAISAYAIYLRVAQYGWTASRVTSAACLAVAACYAGGYAVAALAFGPWLARISRWNFFSALLVLAVLVAIFSPLSDPMRIAVDSQVARLYAGKIDPMKFDFDYLRWRGGRFGREALEKLATFSTGPLAKYVRSKATAALAGGVAHEPTIVAEDLAANFSVYPKGRSLPAGFLHQKWKNSFEASSLPACVTTADVHCDAYLVDLAGDGREEILIVGVDRAGVITSSNGVFEEAPNGEWHLVAIPDSQWACASVVKSLRLGGWNMQPPPAPHWRDVLVGGQTLTVRPWDPSGETCPK